MKRIGIVPVSEGAGAGFVTVMLATELAALRGFGGNSSCSGAGITVVELGRGNLFEQLCADRWFRVRQMVSYWNCLHGEGQVERILNPRCGVNWLLRTPMDQLCGMEGKNPEELERGRAVKLLYSLPGDVAFVDFSSVNEADLMYLLEDMDQVVAVMDPMPSKILGGYERLYRLKLWNKPVTWVVNRWDPRIDGKDLKKVLGNERKWIALPEIPRGLIYQSEYAGWGIAEHQQIRRLIAPGAEELIQRLGV